MDVPEETEPSDGLVVQVQNDALQNLAPGAGPMRALLKPFLFLSTFFGFITPFLEDVVASDVLGVAIGIPFLLLTSEWLKQNGARNGVKISNFAQLMMVLCWPAQIAVAFRIWGWKAWKVVMVLFFGLEVVVALAFVVAYLAGLAAGDLFGLWQVDWSLRDVIGETRRPFE